MTTIVKHRRTGNEYILLGINGEANKANPSRFISELFNQEKSEVSCSATVCDVQGNIFLAYIDELVVVEIDGIRPAEILPEATYKTVNDSLRSPKAWQRQSPTAKLDTEFDDEDFEDDTEFDDKDFEDEDELDPENSEPTTLEASVDVVNSLDAPNHDRANNDEDWI